MFVITGATGNTGKEISRILLSKDQKARAIGRSQERLKDLAKLGAEPFIGDLGDADAMTSAFTGARAVYAMIPPDPTAPDFRAYQNRIGEALATAIKNSGAKFVVNLSSVGAQHAKGVGPVNGLHDQEQCLNKLNGVNVLHLRPAYFMENLLWQAHLIKQMGMMGGPINGEVKFGMIATHDIAAYAADHLLKLDFTGKSFQELQGQRDVSYEEVARVLGKAIGRPDLKYVKFSPEDSVKGMTAMGLSPDVARSYVELAQAITSGHCRFTTPRSAQNTTPTSIEEFASMFRAVYEKS